MTATGFHFTNTATHFIAAYSKNWNNVFGVFVAKGHYIEVILFGKVKRLCEKEA